MNFQGVKRVNGVIRKELDDLWKAVEQRTPMPHGEQILNRTTKGFSVQGGGGGGTAKPTEKSSATWALWGGNVDGDKTVLNSTTQIYDKIYVKVANPNGGLISVRINEPNNLKLLPLTAANKSGVHIWPQYYNENRIILMGTPELNLQAAGDWFLGPTATDLNIDSRMWHADFTGCSYDPVLFKYTTETFAVPFK